MLKPSLVIVATMFLSWGLAFAVNAVRPGDPSKDIVVECGRCHTRQRMSPTPVYSCCECGRVQGARAISRD